jgi:lipopolysaccharide/colanic/teichoic acid biosynthesis glycosyltransferase
MNSSSSNKTSKTSTQTSSTIALTSDDKNVLKRLIQITVLLLVILTIIYLVVGSYVAYKTYVEPTLKPVATA